MVVFTLSIKHGHSIQYAFKWPEYCILWGGLVINFNRPQGLAPSPSPLRQPPNHVWDLARIWDLVAEMSRGLLRLA